VRRALPWGMRLAGALGRGIGGRELLGRRIAGFWLVGGRTAGGAFLFCSPLWEGYSWEKDVGAAQAGYSRVFGCFIQKPVDGVTSHASPSTPSFGSATGIGKA